MIKNILYLLLFIFLASFIYWLLKVLIELKRRNFIGVIFKSFGEKYEERQIEKQAKELYEGSTEDKKFIDRLDELFQRSGVKSIFPFLTSEILVVLTLVIAVLVSILVSVINGFWLYVMAAFILVIFAVILCLNLMDKVTFNKIDKQILTYINLLKNLSKSNSDIVTIFEKSIPYVDSPIKEYAEQFVFECKRGVTIEKAFKNFQDKVESKRFKQLITNILICSKHNENYSEVLNSSRIIFKHYFSEKKRRTAVVREGRFEIILISIIGLFVFKMLEFFTGDILYKLKYTLSGNILLGYFLAVFIFAIYKFVTLDRLNY